ncbi:MAG: dihydrolipoamide acetyltransferase family protein [Proteobacteria bacterium]|nr:dihydrolipoamide acetyltransferase family protein [Pseudomonadota bacterium]
MAKDIPILLIGAAGEYMETAVVVEWHARVGDAIEAGKPLVTIENAKAATEIEAPGTGTLKEIIVEAGSEVPLETLLGVIAGEGAEAEAAPPAEATAPAAATSAKPVAAPRGVAEKTPVRATPLAKRIARELGVDIATVAGSGPRGRIKEADIRKAAGGGAKPTEVAAAALKPTPVPGSVPHRIEQPSGYRRAMAPHMTASAAIPQFTVTRSIRMDGLAGLRRRLKAAQRAGGAVPSVTDFVLRAVALALVDHPRLNARWDDGRIVLFQTVNLGVAVATDHGLVVPVIRGAEGLTVGEISDALGMLAGKAREAKLNAAELADGTFTVSNLGPFGVDRFTALVNPPQAAILAVGAMRTVPVWENDSVAGRPVIEFTLSGDHRVADGADGAGFLESLARRLGGAEALLD